MILLFFIDVRIIRTGVLAVNTDFKIFLKPLFPIPYSPLEKPLSPTQ